MFIRVRPFVRHFERGSAPVLTVEGSIEDRRFVIKAAGHAVELETKEVGSDEYGSYAEVEESSFMLLKGVRMVIEVDPDEDLPWGGVIDVHFEDGTGFAVHFDCGGVANGESAAWNVPREAPTLH